METYAPEAWLNLGIPGAALFIVLIVVLFMFKQQANSVDKLCNKIDALVTSFANTNSTLNEVLIGNDRDQKEVLRKMDELQEILNDVSRRVIRMDTRQYDLLKEKSEKKKMHKEE